MIDTIEIIKVPTDAMETNASAIAIGINQYIIATSSDSKNLKSFSTVAIPNWIVFTFWWQEYK